MSDGGLVIVRRADVETVLREDGLPEWERADADLAHAHQRLSAALADDAMPGR